MTIFNEFMLLFCALLAYVFTDYCSDPRIKYKLGTVWIVIVILTLSLNMALLFIAMLYRMKTSIERFVIKLAYEKRRAHLIKIGLIKVEVQMTEFEK